MSHLCQQHCPGFSQMNHSSENIEDVDTHNCRYVDSFILYSQVSQLNGNSGSKVENSQNFHASFSVIELEIIREESHP